MEECGRGVEEAVSKKVHARRTGGLAGLVSMVVDIGSTATAIEPRRATSQTWWNSVRAPWPLIVAWVLSIVVVLPNCQAPGVRILSIALAHMRHHQSAGPAVHAAERVFFDNEDGRRQGGLRRVAEPSMRASDFRRRSADAARSCHRIGFSYSRGIQLGMEI
jgi:hypothetical protein